MEGSSTGSNKAEWQVGDMLAGRYKVTGVLGAGGMGKVFRAWDEQLGREVAVKTLTSARLLDEEVVRFQREAKAASHLSHPSVIDCYDFGVLDTGQPYMVMEFVDGVTLKTFLKRDGAFEADYVLSILERLTDGLTAIHRSGIVHRDLNTGNIMLIESDVGYSVKILDFGIARREFSHGDTTLTHKDAIIGNPIYMSPEQARGEQVDERSDIYSLGCIAFELLSGHPPFRAGNALATIKMHADEPAPDLASMLTRDQPCVEELNGLLQRALEKRADDRYQTAEELKDEVKKVRCVVQEFIAAQTNAAADGAQPLSRVPKKLSRKAKISVLIGTALLVLVGTVTLPKAWNILFSAEKMVKPKKYETLYSTYKKKNEDMTLVFEEESDKIPIPESGPITGDATAKMRVYQGENGLQDLRTEAASGARVYEIMVKSVKLTANDLKLVQKLEPQQIWLIESDIDDEGLKVLSKIKGLRDLRISQSKRITPAGLRVLSKIPTLTTFIIVDSDLDDEDMEVIGTFPALRQVNIELNRHVTKRGLEALAKSKTIGQIAIAGCACSAIPASKVREFEQKHHLTIHTDLLWRWGDKAYEDITQAEKLF